MRGQYVYNLLNSPFLCCDLRLDAAIFRVRNFCFCFGVRIFEGRNVEITAAEGVKLLYKNEEADILARA